MPVACPTAAPPSRLPHPATSPPSPPRPPTRGLAGGPLPLPHTVGKRSPPRRPAAETCLSRTNPASRRRRGPADAPANRSRGMVVEVSGGGVVSRPSRLSAEHLTGRRSVSYGLPRRTSWAVGLAGLRQRERRLVRQRWRSTHCRCFCNRRHDHRRHYGRHYHFRHHYRRRRRLASVDNRPVMQFLLFVASGPPALPASVATSPPSLFCAITAITPFAATTTCVRCQSPNGRPLPLSTLRPRRRGRMCR